MMNVRALLSLVLVVPVAACSDDGGGSATPDSGGGGGADAPVAIDAPVVLPDAPLTPDAPPVNYDFTCLSNSAPTMADANVTMSGFVREITSGGSLQAAASASVTACKGDCAGENNLGTVSANSTGEFISSAVSTGGVPLDGHIRASKNGNWPTRLYPASPIVADQTSVPVLMIQNGALPLLGLLSGTSQSSNNGIVAMFVTDCANEPVASGATVSFTQNGSAVGTVFNAGMVTSQAAGAFIALNVPPGDTLVTATYNGMEFRAHVVPSVAGTVTTTQIRPGW